MLAMKKTSIKILNTKTKDGDDSTKATITTTNMTRCLTLFPMEKKYLNYCPKIKAKIVHSSSISLH